MMIAAAKRAEGLPPAEGLSRVEREKIRWRACIIWLAGGGTDQTDAHRLITLALYEVMRPAEIVPVSRALSEGLAGGSGEVLALVDLACGINPATVRELYLTSLAVCAERSGTVSQREVWAEMAGWLTLEAAPLLARALADQGCDAFPADFMASYEFPADDFIAAEVREPEPLPGWLEPAGGISLLDKMAWDRMAASGFGQRSGRGESQG